MAFRMKKIPRRFVPGAYDLAIRRSRTGRGLFTRESIPRGTCIIEYTGRPATEAQIKADTGKYLFETSPTTVIDGNIKGNTARFINHSCAPNCEIHIRKRRVYVFAKRAIRAGEELTYDYDTEYFDAIIKPRGCLCDKCLRNRRA
jgi:SET domain-containing protein